MKKIVNKEFGGVNYSLIDKIKRLSWLFFNFFFFRYSPVFFHKYRVFVLKLFGAKIDKGCRIYPSCNIWWPGHLVLGKKVALGPKSIIYNQGVISIGDRSIISQGAYLCSSTHDYTKPEHPLVVSNIELGEDVWVAAQAFVGPSVVIGHGAVIGSRSVVTKNLDAWGVYAGNPCKKIKDRFLND